MSKIRPKKYEIFCGTGGVGKTTLAVSRALNLANKGHKVLLITIDPAKRLKQILNLVDDNAGSIQDISPGVFEDFIPKTSHSSFQFDALLMSPTATMERLLKKHHNTSIANNIIRTLSRPYGGMNEILSLIELKHYSDQDIYDCIILDTPPGRHFIDFLQAGQKIKNFFDKSFIEIFNYLGKSFQTNSAETPKKRNILKLMVSQGVKKLLSYLEVVTGKDFVEEFIDALGLIYGLKDSFLDALSIQDKLQEDALSQWFLVSSAEQYKSHEAVRLQDSIRKSLRQDNFLIINKSLASHLRSWEPQESELLSRFKESMLKRENRLKEFAEENFANVLMFPDVLGSTPLEHVTELANSWD